MNLLQLLYSRVSRAGIPLVNSQFDTRWVHKKGRCIQTVGWPQWNAGRMFVLWRRFFSTWGQWAFYRLLWQWRQRSHGAALVHLTGLQLTQYGSAPARSFFIIRPDKGLYMARLGNGPGTFIHHSMAVWFLSVEKPPTVLEQLQKPIGTHTVQGYIIIHTEYGRVKQFSLSNGESQGWVVFTTFFQAVLVPNFQS